MREQAGRVVRTNPRPERAVIDGLAAAGVSIVHEAQGRTGLLASGIRPIYAGAQIAGSAVTILAPPGDNWMLHVPIELSQPSDILVLQPTSPSDDGNLGNLLATMMMSSHCRGFVMNAGMRNVRDLTTMGLLIWCTAICAQGAGTAISVCATVPTVCAVASNRAGRCHRRG